MVVLSGADLVLPDRVLPGGTIVIEGDRIADVRPEAPGSHAAFAFRNHFIVPGFVDVHVHGVDGVDTLDDAVVRPPVDWLAARLPRYGVTAFCPTTVACAPLELRQLLEQVRRHREAPPYGAARVVGAHLESNFINPEFAGAQPHACLRRPIDALAGVPAGEPRSDTFGAADILAELDRGAPDVAIVTLASELDGGIDLVRWLVARGCRVSLGHSGAGYDEALAAIAAGATHATHLFNRMPPLHHRRPGLVGAVLQTDEVAAELICDGTHVHPAVVRATVEAKRPSHVMAVTDGTALSGMPPGAIATLGRRRITAGPDTALLDDGTIAGSILTMDVAFSRLVGRMGLSLISAAAMCSTTPARQLGLVGCGVLARDAFADLVVLDARYSVVQTYVGGQLVYSREVNAA